MFKPGQTGNPLGYNGQMRMRNKQIEELAREHAAEAVAALVDLMRTGSDSAKRAAAEALLDRAYGKPVDRQAVLNLGPAGEAVEELSRAQLLRIANGALEFANQTSGFRGQVIDLRPVSTEDRDDPPPHPI